MHVTVRSYGYWRAILPGGRDRAEFQIASGTSVGTLLELAGVKEADYVLVAVNANQVDERYALQERDHVAIFCPVEGG